MAKDKRIRKRRMSWEEYQKYKGRERRKKERTITIHQLRELHEEAIGETAK